MMYESIQIPNQFQFDSAIFREFELNLNLEQEKLRWIEFELNLAWLNWIWIESKHCEI